jgi:hypothetical protein
MKFLILNTGDFGQAPEITMEIIRAHREGIVGVEDIDAPLSQELRVPLLQQQRKPESKVVT